MSVNFEREANHEAQEMMREMFAERIFASDGRTWLLSNVGTLSQNGMSALARVAKQPVSVELHSIGDRKDVGGVVYELDEVGWKKLPIGTQL